MQQAVRLIGFETSGRSMLDLTEDLHVFLRQNDLRTGLLTVLCQHTSASLLITEKVSPEVRSDLVMWLDSAAPEGPSDAHGDEGPDDMPAHIKAMLTGNSLSIPVIDSRMLLGTRQGVFLVEHRRRGQGRSLAVHFNGE